MSLEFLVKMNQKNLKRNNIDSEKVRYVQINNFSSYTLWLYQFLFTFFFTN